VSELTQAIQGYLQAVEFERARWAADAALASRVHEVKRYQHARFSTTYADLLSAPASAKAARFFLDELYGPMDFSRRDAQFSRVAPKVATLFPGEVGQIVLSLARLHALSERLDAEMAACVTPASLSETAYGTAWRAVGQASARAEQIELVQAVGLALAKQVRKPLIRTTLRLMRGPAKAAGLDSLQSFLEQGFDAFRDLPDAAEFVRTIATRETSIAAALFASVNSPSERPRAPSRSG
jgi:hypothetical protein